MADDKLRLMQITRRDPQRRIMGSYTQRMGDANVLLEEITEEEAEVGTTWEVEIIEMTESQYAELPEFQGY